MCDRAKSNLNKDVLALPQTAKRSRDEELVTEFLDSGRRLEPKRS